MTTLTELAEQLGYSKQHINNTAERLHIKCKFVGPVKTFNKTQIKQIEKWLEDNKRGKK